MYVRELQKARRCSLIVGRAQSIVGFVAASVLSVCLLTLYFMQKKYFVDLDLSWFIVYMSFCCVTTVISGLFGTAVGRTRSKSLIKISCVVNALNCFAFLCIYSPVQLWFCIQQSLPVPLLLVPGVLLAVVIFTQIFLLKAICKLSAEASCSQGTTPWIITTRSRSAARTHTQGQLGSGMYVVSTRNPDYPVDMAAAPPPYPGYVDLSPPDCPVDVAAVPPPYPGYVESAPPDSPADVAAVPPPYPGYVDSALPL